MPLQRSGTVQISWFSTVDIGGHIIGNSTRKNLHNPTLVFAFILKQNFVMEILALKTKMNFGRWDGFEYRGRMVEKMKAEKAFRKAMRTWSRWVDQNVDKSKTRVFFRTISAEHLGEQWCYNTTEPITDESELSSPFPQELAETVESTMTAMKTPVTFLNITKLSLYRIDAHPSYYKMKEWKTLVGMRVPQINDYVDCGHWCLPGVPDTWNQLLFASLFPDTCKNIAAS